MSKTIREQRFEKVKEVITKYGVSTVLEIGCGNGNFVPYVDKLKQVTRIAVLDKAEKKIEKIRKKYEFIESYCVSFLEYHNFFDGFECVVAIEVIEHLKEEELEQLKQVIFNMLKPRLVIFTTPNRDYNVNYPLLHNGLRHSTHQFEFTTVELEKWGREIVTAHTDYSYYTEYCDMCHSSQIIIFYKEKKEQ